MLNCLYFLSKIYLLFIKRFKPDIKTEHLRLFKLDFFHYHMSRNYLSEKFFKKNGSSPSTDKKSKANNISNFTSRNYEELRYKNDRMLHLYNL